MSWQDNYQLWQKADLTTDLRQDLTAMAHDEAALQEAFTQPLEFGTAGMRGVMGPGINALNIYTVQQATEGLACFMDQLSAEKKAAGVAISYDSRYHSQAFAFVAAGVLGAHGIKSYVFDSLRPTPELSFAVRHLHTYAGIMITASHNPKQYNGYKIYGPDGGQMPPEEVGQIVAYIEKVTDLFQIKSMRQNELRDAHLLQLVGEDVDQAYLAQLATVTVQPELIKKVAADFTLVYSPLHGTGKMLYERVFRQAGLTKIQVVPEQAILDPEFATTPFPNPEFPKAFELAEALGKKTGADLLIATDPDADRLGAAVRQPNGDYHLLTGNQIAALMVNYLLEAYQAQGKLPADGVIVKSIVSSEFPAKVAAHYNIETRNVLTGFKYIGEQIEQMEVTGQGHFLFGFEESYGYLVKSFVRDKDAMQAAVLLAEVAAYYREKGLTMYDGLQSLYREFGHFQERTVSFDFEGLAGQEKMAQVMTEFRQNPVSAVADVAVTRVEDYQAQTATLADGTVSKLALPKANVLKYYLADETWIAVRPSGTEPKIKLYFGVVADSEAAGLQKLDRYQAALSPRLQ
ncbi:phospho-sugar mutase [Lapidilactobacillus achengensis]|uniref:Phosphoglucomutase n=1 Tax=Lapidilactobacillus achengensis TaxID=2486000 RepID=A0ABW1UNZ5_9LACO|nr:phospho-sugar mutase [Lapidilactobacillus achengensis]